MRFLPISLAVGLAAFASIASAQQPPRTGTTSPYGVIVGGVVDSIRGGVLRGALVGVEGTSRTAMTDAAGHFTLDSVPTGDHRLMLFDDLLDTLS